MGMTVEDLIGKAGGDEGDDELELPPWSAECSRDAQLIAESNVMVAREVSALVDVVGEFTEAIGQLLAAAAQQSGGAK